MPVGFSELKVGKHLSGVEKDFEQSGVHRSLALLMRALDSGGGDGSVAKLPSNALHLSHKSFIYDPIPLRCT